MKKKKKSHFTKSYLEKKEKRRLKREFKKELEAWKQDVINRDDYHCQKCKKFLLTQQKHVHHIISLQSVKRKYSELLEDVNNGILLCSYCHKFAPDSAHQGGFEFILWLEKNKPEQYYYLKHFLINKGSI